ncbi:MAG TPA: hypothetical protein DDX92_06845 [Flavobacteriales bacterium]|nr:hypothetical protein [Flavobacteriales bacterium]
MNFIETKNSWKGKLWMIWILWPFIGIPLALQSFTIEESYSIYIKIGLIILWIIWIYFARKPAQFLLDLFKTRR